MSLTSKQVFYGDQAEVKLRADVRDKTFEPAADAVVKLEITSAFESPKTVDMTPIAGERGAYQAVYETPQPGIYRFVAKAKQGDEELGTASFAVRRQDGVVEHFHTQQNRPLLERLAAATGGRYFSLADVDALPEAVSFSDAGTVERQVLELWNMPIVFALLLLLKSAEWLLRLYWGRL